MMYLFFDKLVRNGVPKLVYEENGDLDYFNLKGEQCVKVLKDKIIEEATEVFEAETKDETADEIGDVLDVIDAIMKAMNITKEEVEASRKKKTDFRGDFSNFVYVNWVKMPVDTPEKWAKKYKRITKEEADKIVEKNKEKQ